MATTDTQHWAIFADGKKTGYVEAGSPRQAEHRAKVSLSDRGIKAEKVGVRIIAHFIKRTKHNG